jgi:hypothetical protein
MAPASLQAESTMSETEETVDVFHTTIHRGTFRCANFSPSFP